MWPTGRRGVKAYKISTIVDWTRYAAYRHAGVKAYKISTIVDKGLLNVLTLVGVKAYKISTIVDRINRYNRFDRV